MQSEAVRSDSQRWMGLKAAAASSEVHPVTLRRWCLARLVLARRLARGRGPWRVAVDGAGLVVDGPELAPARARSRRR